MNSSQHHPVTQQVQVSVFVDAKVVFSTKFDSRIELGRQQENEEPLYSLHGGRVVVADIDESKISCHQVIVEVVEDGIINVFNNSSVNSIACGTADPITPKTSRELVLPATITIANRVLKFEGVPGMDHDTAMLESFPHMPAPPGKLSQRFDASIDDILLGRTKTETTLLLKGLHLAAGAFRQSDSVEDFFSSACDGIISVTSLETAAVLLWENNQWNVNCFRSRTGEQEPSNTWTPNLSVLEKVRSDKRTFWQVSDASRGNDPGALEIKALVAAPMLDEAGNVVGVLYGDRRQGKDGRLNQGLTEVKAILVEVLASGIASGIQRMKYQQDAAQAKILFEQFFTPELSRELEKRPDLLVGKDVEVSLLFCEIRGFSDFSEQLGTRLTLDLIQDVMGTLSSCVAESNGTLVDMMGDEIFGMWGAPMERVDHADLACRAAMRMFEELPGLNRRWQQALDRPMDIGIGVHTGVARVGNIGSRQKFKYGPLGATVRVAIEAQRSTRRFGAKILITSDTKNALSIPLPIRQLGQLVEKHSENTYRMYEIMPTPPADWNDLKRRYENAVSAFQKQDFPTAISLLGKVLADHPGDYPSQQLISRIIEAQTPKPWTI